MDTGDPLARAPSLPPWGGRGVGIALALTGKGWDGVGFEQRATRLAAASQKASPHKSPHLGDGACGGMRDAEVGRVAVPLAVPVLGGRHDSAQALA